MKPSGPKLFSLTQAQPHWERIGRHETWILGDTPFGQALHRSLGLKTPLLPDPTSLPKIQKSKKQKPKFLLCVLPALGIEEAKDLVKQASSLDIFLVFFSGNTESVKTGPMVLPQTAQTLHPLTAFSLAYPEWRVLSPALAANTSKTSAMIRRLTSLLIRSLSTPTLPLLWTGFQSTPDSGPEGEESTALQRANNLWHLALTSCRSQHFDLMRFLMKPKALVSTLSKGLKSECLVSISNAFAPELAELVHQALDQCEKWILYEDSTSHFHYRHHNIYKVEDYPPELLTMKLIFESEATQRWMSKLSGKDCSGEPLNSGSWYQPKDHSLPHNDFNGHRKVAYVWHLAKDWDFRWGGALFWCGSGTPIPARFNVLHLFRTTERSYHMVTQVEKGATGKRLSVNGWWTSKAKQPIKSHKKLRFPAVAVYPSIPKKLHRKV